MSRLVIHYVETQFLVFVAKAEEEMCHHDEKRSTHPLLCSAVQTETVRSINLETAETKQEAQARPQTFNSDWPKGRRVINNNVLC